MNKVTIAPQVGTKGSISVILERSTWQPGETVTGQVILKVNAAIDAKSISIIFQGKERLKWKQGKKLSEISFKALAHPTRRIKGELHKRIRYVVHEHIPIIAAQHFGSGDYVFSFELPLPVDLPGTFEYRKRCISDLINIRAGVKYTVTALMLDASTSLVELSANQEVQIMPRVSEQQQSVGVSNFRDVNLLGFLREGQCKVTATLVSNMVRVNEIAEIHCTVQNDSKHRIRHVIATLVQEIEMFPDERSSVQSRIMNSVNHCEVGPSETTSSVLQLPMTSTSRFSSVGRERSDALVPSFSTDLIRISYRIQVQCVYALCPGVSIDLPIVIIPSLGVVNNPEESR